MQIILYKKYLKKAGENISLNNKDEYPNNKINNIIDISFFIIPIIALIITKSLFWLIIIFLFLSFLSISYKNKKYSKINGLYKYGIIYNEYLKWNEVHSYKWIDKETISLLFKEHGNRIDFYNIKEKDKIMGIFNEYNIKENNN